MKRRIRLLVTGAILLLAAIVLGSIKRDIDPKILEQRYAPPPSRFLTLADTRVHYRDEGTGPTLVLVHGTASSLHTWDGWTRRLSQRFRVVRMDLPAFGLTGPGNDDDYTAAGYVRFLHRFLQRLRIERFALAGNSLGGLIAWKYAVTHPREVSALILLDAAGYPRDETPLLIKLGRWPVIGDIMPWLTPYWVVAGQVRNVYGDPARIAPGVVDRYYQLLLREGNRKAFQKYTRMIRIDAGSEAIRSITAPTLIMWGDRDRLIPVEMAERFHRDIRGSQLKIYTGVGHIPMEEIPDRTAADAEAFLGSVTSPVSR